MNERDLLRELLATFSVEAEEHLQAMNACLVAVERTKDVGERERLLAEIFRAAHSLKGASRAVSAAGVEALAHRLETLIDLIRGGELEADRATLDVVYGTLDAMSSLIRETIGGEPAGVDVHDVSAALDEIVGAAAAVERADWDGSSGEGPAPPRAEDGQGDEEGGAPRHPLPPDLELEHPSPRGGTGETVRVATAKLDGIAAQVGELTVAQAEAEHHGAELRALLNEITDWEAEWRRVRSRGAPRLHAREMMSAPRDQVPLLEDGGVRLREVRQRLADLDRALAAGHRQRGQLTVDLREDIRRIRMVPVSTILNGFPRMVRDLAREQDKEIELVIEGAATEVDRFVLEQVKDALIHLLRNCVDHAIERPAARVAAGKPSRGTITVRASQQGDRLLLEIADDGAGIDPEAVKAAAVAKGLLTPGAATAMDDREALWTIFRSGLSTSPIVTDLSGRGVGLDVVYEAVERLQGMIDVESRPGEGTRFALTLPLAVAATRCLLVRSGSQTYGLPISGVVRILRLDPAEAGTAGGKEAIELEGEPIVLAPLSELLAPGSADGSGTSAQMCPAIVVGPAGRRVALRVDAVVGEQDAVVKGLPRPLLRMPGTAGATILGTGEVVIILSVPDLVRAAGRKEMGRAQPAAAQAGRVPTLLVVDDSITTRTLEKNILEAAGYRVEVATDGDEAWAVLGREEIDLLVSDVSMPGMDGFELTERVRGDKRLRELPVILVTSLASDEHRARGIEVGADAYIVKSSFDQDRLLETVRRLS